jgi:hypothetical protein
MKPLSPFIGGVDAHTELRVARGRCGRYPEGRQISPVEAVRKLGGQWPDRKVAITMNWMRCKPADGKSWTTVRVRELRERLGIAVFDPAAERPETISVDQAAKLLGICGGSVYKLIHDEFLPATQLAPSAPWQITVAALTSAPVRQGIQAIIDRRPRNYRVLQGDRTLKLPGF